MLFYLLLGSFSKGLSFVPTAGVNEFKTMIDIQKFFRNVRLREFFNNTAHDKSMGNEQPTSHLEEDQQRPSTSPTRSITPFRGKSTFIPPKFRNSSVDTYCRLVERDIYTVLKNKADYKVADNLDREQRDELRNLKEDKSLVIQSADKGGAIVIMDRTQYDQEIRNQLANTVFYKKLECNPTKTFQRRIDDLLNSLFQQDMITKQEKTFMTVEFPITPVFYILPKIHKTFVDIPPGRPIIAAIGSLTEKISAFVDYFLQPLVTALPSYTRDSMDFIEVIRSIDQIEDSFILVTMDIESLYTNVPFEGGIYATKVFLDKRVECNPSTECILSLIKEVLTSNTFLYDDDYFLQISGVAMGSRMSPSFASLYVGFFEQEYIFNHERNPFLKFISNWRRYLDDVFFYMDRFLCVTSGVSYFYKFQE